MGIGEWEEYVHVDVKYEVSEAKSCIKKYQIFMIK